MYDLRDQILKLGDAERASLLALIEHEETKQPFVARREDDELWQALVRVSPPGVAHRRLADFVRDKQHGVSLRVWREAVATLAEFAAQVTPVRRRDEDRAALVDLALECLAAELKRSKTAVTPKALIADLPHLHHAVDMAFPGYAAAGLLHKLIRLAPRRTPVEAD